MHLHCFRFRSITSFPVALTLGGLVGLVFGTNAPLATRGMAPVKLTDSADHVLAPAAVDPAPDPSPAPGAWLTAITRITQLAQDAGSDPAASASAGDDNDNDDDDDGTAQDAAAADEPKEPTAEELAEKALAEMRQELTRLQTEYQLMQQRQKNDMLALELERQAIAAEAALRSTRQQEELAEMKATMERLQTEASLQRAQQEARFTRMRDEINRLQLESQFETAQRSARLEEVRAETDRLNHENNLLAQQLKRQQLDAQRQAQEYQSQAQSLQFDLTLRSAKDEYSARVIDDMEYRLKPLQGKTLYITDRRISLNGPIFGGTADYVCDRIDYYNNLSREFPIFIVIDDCPGGSVMEGYRIVKAIEESPAPVHVIVKSFAASMAAIITTLAPHSYALPNAIILHHQMSSGLFGNLTQQREALETAREWSRRLAHPVADKMGISEERFVQLMYQNNSNGDWEEFADKAVDLKWVNNIVHEIRELDIRTQPTSARTISFFFMAEMEKEDEKGQPYVKLPRLRPFDYYFMYNPDGYYRY